MINKKIFMIIGIILLAVGATYAARIVLFAGDSQKDIDDGLVLNLDLTQDNYVSGTKTFADDSGNGNNGTSVNAATFTTDKYGKSTGAMSFNGGNDYVSVSSAPNITPSGSLSAWVYVNSWDTYYDSIIFKGPGDSWGEIDYGIIRLSTTNTFLGTINDGTNNLGGSGPLSSAITPGQWYHLVFTWNSSVTKFYTDGIQTGSVDWNHGAGGRSNNMKIGSAVTGGEYFFNGSISEVKIWNRALSPAEVQALYNSSKPKMSASSIESGLVGHWLLDGSNYDSVTGTVTDKTPYENHGTNSGATLTTDRMGQSNGAMSFDGSNDVISTSTNNLNLQEMTICVWIKVNAFVNNYPTIANKETSNLARNWFLGFVASTQKVVFGRSVGGADNGVTSNTTFSTGIWYFLCGRNNLAPVFDIFVNGVLDNTATYSGALSTAGSTGWIGNYRDYVEYYFNGSIADVRIYNKALSATEIKTLYDSYKPKVASDTLKKGLVLDMPLTSSWTQGGAAGSEVMTDKTPYSNNGQNYGASVGSSYTNFDGSNDYIVAPPVNLSRFSVGAWVKPGSIQNGYASIISDSYPPEVNYKIGFVAGTLSLTGGIYHSSTWYNTEQATLTSNVWSHVIFTYDGANMRLYVNNVLIGTPTALVTTPSSSGTELRIGRRWDLEDCFNGSMSGVKIYNRALSESEIKLLYDRGR